jgi:phosphoribosylformylglycinamidine synthase
VGDPFTEKLLIEATMQMFAENLVEGIQDLGGAGLSCATSELASNGSAGMRVRLEEVPLRDSDLSPEEILMSESQERMCAIVHPDNLERVLKICGQWGVKAAVIGEITAGQNLIITWHGEEIVNVPPGTVAHEGPEYQRPYVLPPEGVGHQPLNGSDLGLNPTQLKTTILKVLASSEFADVTAITNQYDRYVRGSTVLAAGADAGLIRVSDESKKGVAISLDGNARSCAVDPNRGVQWSVLEACRNVSAVGGRPLALTNCLNFGSPEDPTVMGQFAATTDGLAKAAIELDLPVTGGNVSFYNQTGQVAILPTPVIGVLGVIDDVTKHVGNPHLVVGDVIYVLGEFLADLSGSLFLETEGWSKGVHSLPEIDYEVERRLFAGLVALINEGLVAATHDISEGGLITALVEMVRGHDNCALRITPDDSVEPYTWAFAEFGGRVVCVVQGQSVSRFEKVVSETKLTHRRIGEVISSNSQKLALEIEGFCLFTHEELIDASKKGMLLKH